MTLIAVISDSHIPSRSEKIPKEFWNKIEEADITVHAGDYDRQETFNAVEEYSKEFYGVKGNCDFFEEEEMKESATFSSEGLKFGVYHGTGITPRADKPTLEKIAVEDLECDILIHGHSHQEDIYLGEKLLINPGSCTGAGGGTTNPDNPSMILIQVEDEISVKILEKQGEEIINAEAQSFSREEIKEG